MTLKQLQHRVGRAEALLEGRGQQLVEHCGALRRTWAAAWTPGRIVIAGLGLGFLAGLSEPKTALVSLAGKVGAIPKLVELASAVSALLATLRPSQQPASDEDVHAVADQDAAASVEAAAGIVER